MKFIPILLNLILDTYFGMFANKLLLLGYVTVKRDATIEHEMLCQRSNSYHATVQLSEALFSVQTVSYQVFNIQ
jgi:hypothetical protein